MTDIMRGVRIVEVAEHAFVPGASAVLSDWGAEVVKIEPIGRGDAGRGVGTAGSPQIMPMYHHVNRGKKSLALDLSLPEAREIVFKLAESADVFLTNKVRRVRQKLEIDVEHIRAHNPRIIYVRGTGNGERGSQADRGSYDLLNFWHRSGASIGASSPEGHIPFLPAPGFGDCLGAMTIAGGIMGALYHRERTGEARVVDVSLLSMGTWAMSAGIAAAAVADDWPWPPRLRNPLSWIYQTKDGRWLALCCLQAGHYWAPVCELIGRSELVGDARFSDHASILRHHAAASALLAEAFAQRTLDEWCQRLEGFVGQWAIVQDLKQVISDPQVRANGYLQPCETASGLPFVLVAPPVQYDEQPAAPRRGPDYNEHCDELLASIGFDADAVIDLKSRGVVG